MIKVVCSNKENNFFKEVRVFGHSNFSDFGTDIICSAVSSIVFGSFSFFKKNYPNNINCDNMDNEIVFSSNEVNEYVLVCLSMMIYQLENISAFYPDYLLVKKA
ncbi:MAG TPA: ribosomal-processing cysteine protease Prp [Mycoplasmatales bacterium]|jgi:uncharacterized protein|nr:ribosomal-processing cysteine protease Prp [Mycoplasmatales bacterium]